VIPTSDLSSPVIVRTFKFPMRSQEGIAGDNQHPDSSGSSNNRRNTRQQSDHMAPSCSTTVFSCSRGRRRRKNKGGSDGSNEEFYTALVSSHQNRIQEVDERNSRNLIASLSGQPHSDTLIYGYSRRQSRFDCLSLREVPREIT
jgi:hypothetical protein